MNIGGFAISVGGPGGWLWTKSLDVNGADGDGQGLVEEVAVMTVCFAKKGNLISDVKQHAMPRGYNS